MLFRSHYPTEKRPFYAKNSPNGYETESFDLLFRGLEITTGGQRIHDYCEQIEKMKSKNIDIEEFQSYLLAHKHGMPPHGGLGLGLERLTAQICGFQNIRRATLFPRDKERLEP